MRLDVDSGMRNNTAAAARKTCEQRRGYDSAVLYVREGLYLCLLYCLRAYDNASGCARKPAPCPSGSYTATICLPFFAHTIN